MKIAITAGTDAGLDAPVAGHFGQAPFFVLVEVVDGAIAATETLANPFRAAHQPGEVPSFIRAHGAEVILSGGMGMRAIRIFEAVGVTAATGASGTVRQAVTGYLQGALAGASPCADSVEHHRSIVCIPVTHEGQVGHSWGRAHTVALATVAQGTITSWRTETVQGDVSKDQGSEGSHHARVARFVRDNAVTAVLARHMGDDMQNMLTRLGVRVRQGVDGDARAAVAAR